MKPSKGSRNGEFRGQNFGGFVYVLDGFPQRDFVLWVFMYPINIILFYGYHAKGFHAPSLPPRAITPVYASRLSRHSIFLLLGYHTRAITLHHTRTSGYHTRHSSSYVVVYLSPAITPPILLHLHHHRGATRTNLLHKTHHKIWPKSAQNRPLCTKPRTGVILGR